MNETHSSTDQLDLSPITTPVKEPKKRKLAPMLVIFAVVAGIGFVLFNSLGDAALFFYNADEAVTRQQELEGQRIRVQGTPFGEPVSTDLLIDGVIEPVVVFPIGFGGKLIDVVHTGSPAELFQPGVPVVLEGQWEKGFPQQLDPVIDGANDGWHFRSSEMVVKHDNEYRNDNRDQYEQRLQDAKSGGSETSDSQSSSSSDSSNSDVKADS